MTQVAREHYAFDRYVQRDRWASYYYQLQEILALRPTSVLEVGVGGSVLRSQLATCGHISYIGVDSAADVQPDVVADVTALPFPDSSVDVVCAFEVLEHLPFDSFDVALSELSRVSKGAVILSLPHFGPPVQLLLKLPLLPEIRISYKIPIPLRHKWNGEHYWEIGKKGYPLSLIRLHLAQFFEIRKDFIPFEHQYHHFFVLQKLDK